MAYTGKTSSFYFGISQISGAKEINVSRFMASAVYDLTTAMRNGAEKIKRDLEYSVRTWETDVDFSIEIERNGDMFYVTVFTDNEIFKFVNDGTSVRRALMTPDFIPKTIPRVVGSRRGRGGVAYIDKRIARPGIEAREFIETSFDDHSRETELEMERAFNRNIDEAWNSAFQ